MRIPDFVVLFPLLACFTLPGETQVSSVAASVSAPQVESGTATPTVDASTPTSDSQSPSSPAPASAASSPVTLQARPAVPAGPDYRVGAGDVLRISVWEEPQFTTTATVRPDGKISIPLISDLSVSGMSPEAVQNLLSEQLTKFVRHPRVTVIVEEIHSRIVYITGEVLHPGAYPLIGPMNVVQLVARAGGLTEFAKKKDVYVLHQDGGVRVKVNYQMVLAGKHLEENIGLVPGDTVVVP